MLTLLPASFASGCAWLRYPERRWQQNPGPVEVFPLVIDCLLFIPGLVPGIVALAIDFGTRSIYVPRGQARRVDPGDIVSVGDKAPEQLELRVLDASAREIASTHTCVDPDSERQRLSLHASITGPCTMELLVDGRHAASARVAS
jgi:hypothetical protein